LQTTRLAFIHTVHGTIDALHRKTTPAKRTAHRTHGAARMLSQRTASTLTANRRSTSSALRKTAAHLHGKHARPQRAVERHRAHAAIRATSDCGDARVLDAD
jgi:hypothetical protein